MIYRFALGESNPLHATQSEYPVYSLLTRLEAAARRRGLNSVEQLLETWQAGEEQLAQFQTLARRWKDWFWALHAITGANPVPAASRGNVQAMAEAWLQWGSEKGYKV